MTKIIESYINLGEDSDKEFRRDMMRVMSEVSLNPANVIPARQEELAMFMVNELKSLSEPSTTSSIKWEFENVH